ncbi:MAG: sigma-70 family RNA polymerase sigma factor [Burkholderiales bacterium]|nr:sigma-70 family RNA polymerase sigma factor [Burkholderiales bacterium]
MGLLSFLGHQPPLGERLAANRAALYRLAVMWCHDRALADDLAQEALTKALARSAQLRDPDKLRPWLYGILVNCWRDHLRASRPTQDIDAIEEDLLVESVTPELVCSQRQLAACVRSAVASLPVGQREVLGLVDLEGCSYADVAQILSLPIGTVMSRLCRARAALREKLAEVEPERTRLRSIK